MAKPYSSFLFWTSSTPSISSTLIEPSISLFTVSLYDRRRLLKTNHLVFQFLRENVDMPPPVKIYESDGNAARHISFLRTFISSSSTDSISTHVNQISLRPTPFSTYTFFLQPTAALYRNGEIFLRTRDILGIFSNREWNGWLEGRIINYQTEKVHMQINKKKRGKKKNKGGGVMVVARKVGERRHKGKRSQRKRPSVHKSDLNKSKDI